MFAPPEPTIVLIFGPNCVGKSTVGKELAGLLDRCAFIEIDVLHYMVVGGLVAWGAGASPLEQPEEYRRQCELGLANAVRLAHGFADTGFSSVLEGLEDECLPGTNWADRVIPDREVFHVGLVCSDSTLVERLEERGWRHDAFVESVRARIAWIRDNAALFDAVADTTGVQPEVVARQIARQLFV